MLCYFQIRRRTLLTGYFKAQERKKQDCNALRPRSLFSALSAYSAKRNSKTATWAIVGLSHSVASKRSCLVARGAWCMHGASQERKKTALHALRPRALYCTFSLLGEKREGVVFSRPLRALLGEKKHCTFRTFRIFRIAGNLGNLGKFVGVSRSVASKLPRGAWCVLPAPPQLRCW